MVTARKTTRQRPDDKPWELLDSEARQAYLHGKGEKRGNVLFSLL